MNIHLVQNSLNELFPSPKNCTWCKRNVLVEFDQFSNLLFKQNSMQKGLKVVTIKRPIKKAGF